MLCVCVCVLCVCVCVCVLCVCGVCVWCVCVCMCASACVHMCMCMCVTDQSTRIYGHMQLHPSCLRCYPHFHLHLCLAAGKSTFLELLQVAHPEYIIVNEPLVRWQNVPDGVEGEGLTCSQQHGGNLLDHFYKDPQRWGYTFQV